MEATMLKCIRFGIVGLGTALVTSNVVAVELKIIPSLSGSETYTDNVRLAPYGSKESSFVTVITPGVRIDADSPHLKLHADYQLQNINYSKEGSTITSNHLLNSGLNSVLIEDLFFLDGNAQIAQQNLSPFKQQSSNNLDLNNNRAEVKSFRASPYFKKNFFNAFSTELRYTYDSVSTNSASIANSKGQTTELNVVSGNQFQTITWGAHIRDEQINYSQFSDVAFKSESVDLGLIVTPNLMLKSSAGYESNSYLTNGDKPSGKIWLLGLKWHPTERTQISASAGKRYYGNTYNFVLDHRTRATVWSINYGDDVITNRSQFVVPSTKNTADFFDNLYKAKIPDAATRKIAVDNFIQNQNLPSTLSDPIHFGTNRVYLQHSLQASLGLIGARNTLFFSANRTRNDAQSTINIDSILLGSTEATLLANTKQYGASALWSLRLTPITNFNAYANASRVRSLNTGVVDNNRVYSASVSRQLSPKLHANFEARRNVRRSTNTASNTSENSIMLSLLLGF